MLKTLIFILMVINNVMAEEQVYYDFDYNEYNSNQSYDQTYESFNQESEDYQSQDYSNDYMAHDERIFLHQPDNEPVSEPM